MSIKGTTKELYIGKDESNIITLMGNRVTIPYKDVKRIDYLFAKALKQGFFNFITYDNNKIQFEFGSKVNEKIQKAVDFISGLKPDIEFRDMSRVDFGNIRSVRIVPTFGYKELGLSSMGVTINQNMSGDVYFNSNDTVFYSLIGYEWNGPDFDKIIKTNGKTKEISKTAKKGKSLKVGVGAIVGGTVAGPLGATIGAAMGVSGKGNEKTSGNVKSSTLQIETLKEKTSAAILVFRNNETGIIYKLSFNCNQNIDSKIRCFNFSE